MKIHRKKLFFGILLAIIVAVAVGFAWHSFRYSDEEILRCTTVIEEQSYDEISIDGKPKLFVGDINSPSSLADATTIKDSSRWAFGSTAIRYCPLAGAAS